MGVAPGNVAGHALERGEADLLAVVDERDAGGGEEDRRRQAEDLHPAADGRCEPLDVVVAEEGRQTVGVRGRRRVLVVVVE